MIAKSFRNSALLRHLICAYLRYAIDTHSDALQKDETFCFRCMILGGEGASMAAKDVAVAAKYS